VADRQDYLPQILAAMDSAESALASRYLGTQREESG
jgi:hypothetical protein